MNIGNLKGLDMAAIVDQAARLQRKVSEAKEAAGRITVLAEAGGGMVRVTATGAQRITDIKLEPEVVNADDMEMLEDLIIAGVNKALEDAGEAAQREMDQASAGFLPPELDLSPFGR